MLANISLNTGITQEIQPSRIPRDLNRQEHVIMLTVTFEASQNGVINVVTNDDLTDIYTIDIAELLIAANQAFTGTSLYLRIQGFEPGFDHSYVTYMPDGTTMARDHAVAIIPGIPGVFHEQRYATWKNGEGKILGRFKITCQDSTGALVPILGMIRFKITTLRW